MPDSEDPLRSHPLRIYRSIRTAHLERFRDMTPATVLFQQTRYDFDQSLSAGLALRRLSRLGVLRELLRRHHSHVEINEPFTLRCGLDVLAQIAVIRLRGLFTRRRAVISTYCLGHTDPASELPRFSSLPRPLRTRWVLESALRVLMWICVRSVDRWAFGTPGCREVYGRYVDRGRLDVRARTFTAIPARCQCRGNESEVAPGPEVLFVGGFLARKGIRQLMAAWDASTARSPRSALHLIGQGPLLPEVRAWAADRSEVSLEVDPGRERVHRALRRADVVVLLSQRDGGWREQVGLPIVEALAHGCEVVTTTETGLADWLVTNGHIVLEPNVPAATWSAAIETALTKRRAREHLLAMLPAQDQRLAADSWMFQ